MERSFGASTSTLLATPTPLDRRSRPATSSSPLASASTLLAHNQLAQSIGHASTSSALQPRNLNASASSPAASHSLIGATKAVRFSPAHASTTASFSNAYSSAPSSRIQSIATPPRSLSSPSLSALQRSSSYGVGSGAAATPPRPQPSYQQVAKHVQHSVQAVAETPERAVQEIKHKLEAAPIGRGEAARRLRVNAVLLVAWWVSSRTAGYRFAAGHLVALLPALDTPLLVFETLLLFLLGWNILDSLRALQKLSALPSTRATVNPILTTTISSRPGPVRSTSASASTPVRSSPKTRAHPSPLVSRFVSPAKSTQVGANTSPFRSSSLASDTPPTPQTPTSALNRNAGSVSASALSRRSLGGLGGSPGGASPLGRSVSSGATGTTPLKADEINGALLAYEARHSPTNPRVSINTKEEIDRLFE
ncbi:uncharacterized protein JCM15063_002978 [Sporobolomyces koalae]|uniref:uncharacterized protein n=1 Tax=Sporobolomyces koalae TaxID=500713 RepID=UPI00317425EE